MTKTTVTKLFVGSLIAIGAGAILAVIAVALALANNVFVWSGMEVVGVTPSPLALSLLVLGLASAVVIIGGFVGGLVAWIGSLLNTAQLENKGWFVGLLLLGIFNLGLFAMIAYVIAGPDGTVRTAPRNAAALA